MLNTSWPQSKSDHNLPSGENLNTFKMCQAMWIHCAHWVHFDCDHNVLSNVISMCPVGTFWLQSQCTHQCELNVPAAHILISFTMFPSMCPACGWATHSNFFHKVPSDVSRMCTAIYMVISLKVRGEIEQYWDYIVITSKRTPWGHYGHNTG